ncbi:MAG: bacteriohemerythrin [Anaerolineaceae bacterium]
MAFYSWKQEYSVGNDLMDEQHQVLIEMINKLHDAMKIGKGNVEAGHIVTEMIDYSVMHFSMEEKFAYTGRSDHNIEHTAFMTKADEFRKHINTGSFTLSMEVANFLKDWLTNHILVNDMAYSKVVKK